MNELQTILGETAARLLSDHVTKELIQTAEQGQWPKTLWTALEENGLTRVLVPEAANGAGGTWSDAMIILKAAGEHAAPVPLGETILAAGVLSQAGLPVPDGPITLLGGGISLNRQGPHWTAHGEAARVPWARFAGHGVALADTGDGVVAALAPLADAVISHDTNLALEPRDTVRLDGIPVEASPLGLPADALTLYGAIVRAGQMAGALDYLLTQSVTYANERIQFGRPIGKFQAIQQELAVLATHTAAAGTAATYAAACADKGDARFEIAVAKIRADEAANAATGIAHQVHGALGFTYEHSLQFATRRLWSWRAEFGSGAYWATRIGRDALGRGADALWPYITGR